MSSTLDELKKMEEELEAISSHNPTVTAQQPSAPLKREPDAVYLVDLNPDFPDPSLYFKIRDKSQFKDYVLHRIPDKPDLELFYFDVNWLWVMWECLECNISMNMAGPPGCGKTTLTPALAGLLQIPYIEVVGSEETEGSDLIGSYQIDNGTSVFQEGELVAPLEGGVLCVIDEWDKILSVHNTWLHSAMDGRNIISLPQHRDPSRRRIPIHPESRIILAGNTVGGGDGIGMYNSHVQDEALLDRFTSTLKLDYPPHHIEKNLISIRYPTVQERELNKIVEMATKVRVLWKEGKLKSPWSVRKSFGMAAKFSVCKGRHHGLRIAQQVYGNKLADSQEQAVFTEIATSLFS